MVRGYAAALAGALLALAACVPVRTAAPPALPPQSEVAADSREAPVSEPATPTPGERAALHALSLLGVPYRFGGSTVEGLDCSGLVQHAYAAAGVALPRDTLGQRRQAVPVAMEGIEPGDLLFYRRGRGRALHVTLYVGEGRFVHAPSHGGQVRLESVAAPHWKRRFVEARRPAERAASG